MATAGGASLIPDEDPRRGSQTARYTIPTPEQSHESHDLSEQTDE